MGHRFDAAMDFTLPKEGGFVDHPNDPGGATNFGISLRTLRDVEGTTLEEWDFDGDGDVDADDMRILPLAKAFGFYREHFWYSELDKMSAPDNAIKLFDMGVNMGKRQAVKLFQRSLQRFNPGLGVDGVFGPRTQAAEVRVVREGKFREQFEILIYNNVEFYIDLVERKRSREVFLFGWLRRARSRP